VQILLERNESGRVSSTQTGTAVFDGLVRDGELPKIVASHLRLDLNRVKDFAIVNANNTADHLWDDDHVTKVGLNNCRLLIWRCFLLRLTQLLDETHGTALEPTLEPPSRTGMDEVDKVLIVHVKELLKLNTAVRKRAERSLLLHLSGLSRVGDDFVRLGKVRRLKPQHHCEQVAIPRRYNKVPGHGGSPCWAKWGGL